MLVGDPAIISQLADWKFEPIGYPFSLSQSTVEITPSGSTNKQVFVH